MACAHPRRATPGIRLVAVAISEQIDGICSIVLANHWQVLPPVVAVNSRVTTSRSQPFDTCLQHTAAHLQVDMIRGSPVAAKAVHHQRWGTGLAAALEPNAKPTPSPET